MKNSQKCNGICHWKSCFICWKLIEPLGEWSMIVNVFGTCKTGHKHRKCFTNIRWQVPSVSAHYIFNILIKNHQLGCFIAEFHGRASLQTCGYLFIGDFERKYIARSLNYNNFFKKKNWWGTPSSTLAKTLISFRSDKTLVLQASVTPKNYLYLRRFKL